MQIQVCQQQFLIRVWDVNSRFEKIQKAVSKEAAFFFDRERCAMDHGHYTMVHGIVFKE
jgi:hypothetical protein